MSAPETWSSSDDASKAWNEAEFDNYEQQKPLLQREAGLDEAIELNTAPLFTETVRQQVRRSEQNSQDSDAKLSSTLFTQYGLLAENLGETNKSANADGRIWFNTAAPSSVFVCGSQGSGKSHTLSCLLENCLMQSTAAKLPRPLTGLVFHYDTFISDSGGSPCEVAYLSSESGIQVRVLCAPTNTRTIRQIYSRFPHIKVEELRLNQAALNTKRMLDLMAASSGTLPLYLHVVTRILRDLRIEQQETGESFNYSRFKDSRDLENMTDAQKAPLKQRLDTLESFLVKEHAGPSMGKPSKGAASAGLGSDWKPTRKQLTIVDLSCPCVTAEMACQLFNICLGLFLEQESTVGRVVALDEAHKYMTESPEALTLTDNLLATIRLQRHLGARVFISTQEPTISPKLLDLCTVTVVHRFTSPDWLASLKRHLAGVSVASRLLDQARKHGSNEGEEEAVEGIEALTLNNDDPALALFAKIVSLRVGEAFVFAPSALIGVAGPSTEDLGKGRLVSLSHGVLKVRIRNRITSDGGQSILAR